MPDTATFSGPARRTGPGHARPGPPVRLAPCHGAEEIIDELMQDRTPCVAGAAAVQREQAGLLTVWLTTETVSYPPPAEQAPCVEFQFWDMRPAFEAPIGRPTAG